MTKYLPWVALTKDMSGGFEPWVRSGDNGHGVRELGKFGEGPFAIGNGNAVSVRREEIEVDGVMCARYTVTVVGGPIYRADPGALKMSFEPACEKLAVEAIFFDVPFVDGAEPEALGAVQIQYQPLDRETKRPANVVHFSDARGTSVWDLRLNVGSDGPEILEQEFYKFVGRGPHNLGTHARISVFLENDPQKLERFDDFVLHQVVVVGLDGTLFSVDGDTSELVPAIRLWAMWPLNLFSSGGRIASAESYRLRNYELLAEVPKQFREPQAAATTA